MVTFSGSIFDYKFIHIPYFIFKFYNQTKINSKSYIGYYKDLIITVLLLIFTQTLKVILIMLKTDNNCLNKFLIHNPGDIKCVKYICGHIEHIIGIEKEL